MNDLEQKLRDAADEVSSQPPGHKQRYGAGALPGWLAGILLAAAQQYGPELMNAAIQFLQSHQHPTPTPTPGK